MFGQLRVGLEMYLVPTSLNSSSYIELLCDQVFSDMRKRLGEEMFGKMCVVYGFDVIY